MLLDEIERVLRGERQLEQWTARGSLPEVVEDASDIVVARAAGGGFRVTRPGRDECAVELPAECVRTIEIAWGGDGVLGLEPVYDADARRFSEDDLAAARRRLQTRFPESRIVHFAGYSTVPVRESESQRGARPAWVEAVDAEFSASRRARLDQIAKAFADATLVGSARDDLLDEVDRLVESVPGRAAVSVRHYDHYLAAVTSDAVVYEVVALTLTDERYREWAELTPEGVVRRTRERLKPGHLLPDHASRRSTIEWILCVLALGRGGGRGRRSRVQVARILASPKKTQAAARAAARKRRNL